MKSGIAAKTGDSQEVVGSPTTMVSCSILMLEYINKDKTNYK